MFQCSNIFKSYAGAEVVKDITFNLASGESLVVTGQNGSGKTTLLKVLATYIEQDKGLVRLNEINSIQNISNYRQQVEGCFPNENGFFSHLTFFENLKIFSKINGQAQNDFLSSLDSIQKHLPLAGLLSKQFFKGSRGNKQLLHISRSLILPREVYILDEPYHYLDFNALGGFKSILDKYSIEGKNLIVSAQTSDLSHFSKFKHLHLGDNA